MRQYLSALAIAGLAAAFMSAPVRAGSGPPPAQYGRVIIKSQGASLEPVVFDHWLHRAIYTCRLCHVDIGFAMQAGGTGITAENNINGYYCGACHNGAMVYGGTKIFASCAEKYTPEEAARCVRCHSPGESVKKDFVFDKFTEYLPKKGLGNGIDWEEAEAKGLIRPMDFVKGVSVKKSSMKMQKDVELASKSTWMEDVIFSHKKHAVWNGCEVCHPEIFPPAGTEAVQYTMLQIFDGQYCGVCHDKVAFPLAECDRCHTKPVQ